MGGIQYFEGQGCGGRLPGKINASLNEKLQTVEWGEYQLSDLFDVKTTKSIDKNKISFDRAGEFDFIGRSSTDNGVQGRINKLEYEPNPKETFSLVQVGESICLYRDHAWYASQNIFILHPLCKRIIKSHIFISSAINKALWLYKDAYIYPTLNEVKELYIQLPIKNGRIDYDFMESFIAELKNWHMDELRAYLYAAKLTEYQLTAEEEKVISDYLNERIFFQWYRLGDLFEIRKTASFNSDRLVAGNHYEYVTRTSLNQGVLHTTGFVNEENTNEPNVWSLGLLQMSFFYRRKPWYAGQFVRKIIPKGNISVLAALYFSTIFNKQKTKLLSVLVRDVDKTFQNLKVQIPTKNGKIDFSLIEKFITAIQKLVIRDVVLYSEGNL